MRTSAELSDIKRKNPGRFFCVAGLRAGSSAKRVSPDTAVLEHVSCTFIFNSIHHNKMKRGALLATIIVFCCIFLPPLATYLSWKHPNEDDDTSHAWRKAFVIASIILTLLGWLPGSKTKLSRLCFARRPVATVPLLVAYAIAPYLSNPRF